MQMDRHALIRVKYSLQSLEQTAGYLAHGTTCRLRLRMIMDEL